MKNTTNMTTNMTTEALVSILVKSDDLLLLNGQVMPIYSFESGEQIAPLELDCQCTIMHDEQFKLGQKFVSLTAVKDAFTVVKNQPNDKKTVASAGLMATPDATRHWKVRARQFIGPVVGHAYDTDNQYQPCYQEMNNALGQADLTLGDFFARVDGSPEVKTTPDFQYYVEDEDGDTISYNLRTRQAIQLRRVDLPVSLFPPHLLGVGLENMEVTMASQFFQWRDRMGLRSGRLYFGPAPIAHMEHAKPYTVDDYWEGKVDVPYFRFRVTPDLWNDIIPEARSKINAFCQGVDRRTIRIRKREVVSADATFAEVMTYS